MATEKLIKKVRKNKILYDFNEKDYKNVKKKDKIWDKLAAEIGGNGSDLKKKWKNLRDSYSKYLRSETSTGQETKLLDRYKAWPWASQMEFLLPFLQFTRTNSNNISKTLAVSSENGHLERESQNDPTDPLEIALPSPNTKKRKRKCQTIHPSPVEPAIDGYLEKWNSGGLVGLDNIDLLFLSYARTLKTFSVRRQALLKLKIAEIFMQEELDQDLANFDDTNYSTAISDDIEECKENITSMSKNNIYEHDSDE